MRRECRSGVVLGAAAALMLVLATTVSVAAQTSRSRQRVAGTAVVRVADGEYTIPIDCDDAARPELGFSTEPGRLTRERTGRTSGVNLRVRPSGQPDEVIVTLDRYVAWLPQPSSTGGVLSMQMDLSPASVVRDNMPVLLTRDMWVSGDRPEGLRGVTFEARCAGHDPDAPAYRRVP